MGFLLRAIVIVVLISLVRFVLFRLFGVGRRRASPEASANRFRNQPRTIAGKMVKDPQCGIYVASELALPVRSGAATLHFCSRRCRDEYLESRTVHSAAP